MNLKFLLPSISLPGDQRAVAVAGVQQFMHIAPLRIVTALA